MLGEIQFYVLHFIVNDFFCLLLFCLQQCLSPKSRCTVFKVTLTSLAFKIFFALSTNFFLFTWICCHEWWGPIQNWEELEYNYLTRYFECYLQEILAGPCTGWEVWPTGWGTRWRRWRCSPSRWCRRSWSRWGDWCRWWSVCAEPLTLKPKLRSGIVKWE